MVRFQVVGQEGDGGKGSNVRTCLVCGCEGELTVRWPAVRVDLASGVAEGWWCPQCLDAIMSDAGLDGEVKLDEATDLVLWTQQRGTNAADFLGAIAWSVEIATLAAYQVGMDNMDTEALVTGAAGSFIVGVIRRLAQQTRQGRQVPVEAEPQDGGLDDGETVTLSDGVW